MGYNDDRILKVDQELLEPCDRIEIQVVGRLVEKQDVRIAEQRLCEKNFDLLGTGQDLSSFCSGDPSRFRDHLKVRRVGLCLPAVHRCELALQLGCLDAVLLGELFFCVDGFFSFMIS